MTQNSIKLLRYEDHYVAGRVIRYAVMRWPDGETFWLPQHVMAWLTDQRGAE
jgi:hypothetical protein